MRHSSLSGSPALHAYQTRLRLLEQQNREHLGNARLQIQYESNQLEISERHEGDDCHRPMIWAIERVEAKTQRKTLKPVDKV